MTLGETELCLVTVIHHPGTCLLITLLLIFLDVQIVFEGIEGKFIEEESDERDEQVNEVEEQRQ